MSRSASWRGHGSRRARSAWIDQTLARLMGRTGPLAGDHALKRNNIFILPSRPGLLCALVLLAMLIASINYSLALGFALTFLISSIALVAMLHTFRNLSALTLRPGRGEPVFAGELTEASVMVLNPSRLERFALAFDAPGMARTELVDIPSRAEQQVRIALVTERRGWYQVPRLTISSTFPLGLWRAWSYWQPAQRVLVYPRPESPPVPLPESSAAAGTGIGRRGAQEDLAAINVYRPGDNPRRIAWKAVARTGARTLLVKQFEGGERGELLLAWRDLPAQLDTEARLARLTRWVLSAEASNTPYALSLGAQTFGPDFGPAHRARCLEALATWAPAGESA